MQDREVSEISHGEKRERRVEEPQYPIKWPHEVGKLKETAALMSKIGIKSITMPSFDRVERSKMLMERINGKGSGILADKFQFTEVVRKIGYKAPLQGLALREQTPEQRNEAVRNFYNREQAVICKPHKGSGGSGIVEMKAVDLENFLPKIGKDYIIQEKVPIQAEVRYVRDIDNKSGTILRIYDEKEIPKLKGNGEKTKWQLIRRSEMPKSAKIATAFRNKESLGTVVPDGAAVHISRIGVPQKQELEWGPQNRQRVENMDKFMRRFLTDLQTEIGHPLPLVCFDMGITDISALDGDYNYEKMKENIVPFECQMPFTLGGYIARSRKNPEGKSITT